MNERHQRHHRGDDHAREEAAVHTRRPAADREERPTARDSVPQDPAVDYRQWRRDRYKKFGEAFDHTRAQRPARSGAAGSHTRPPSEGTNPRQPYSAAPGASGKNK